jgi:hypothetical protein
VGLRRHPPNPLRRMVVRLPQRLVLASPDKRSNCLISGGCV